MKTIITIILLTITLFATGCSTRPGEDEFNKGIEAHRANNTELAQQMFEQSLQKNPLLAEAHINLGMVYIKINDPERAWNETMAGLDLINKTKKTIIIGGTWEEQAALANNNLAKIVFDKAIAARENNDLENMEKFKAEALRYLEKAAKLYDENELITKNIAYIKQWPN